DSGSNVYVTDYSNHTIRRVDASGAVTTLAGLAEHFGSSDGSGTSARFNYPEGIAVDKEGTLYVTDTTNSVVRKVSPAGEVTTRAGAVGRFGSADGIGTSARFRRLSGIGVDIAGNLYV